MATHQNSHIAPHAENRTILCVDDEDGILKFYEEWLGFRAVVDINTQYGGLSKRRMDKVRIVDEVETLRASGLGSGTYNLITARSGQEAVELATALHARGEQIAVGFFDMKMPGGMDGLATIRAIKSLMPEMLVAVVTAYNDYPVATIGNLFTNQDEWVYFNKPFTHNELIQTVRHLVYGWNMRRERERVLSTLEDTNKRLINTMVQMLEARDPYTHGHSHRTAIFGKLIGQKLGMSPTECVHLEQCCLLHDIGKMGIRDEVLLKKGKLTRTEFDHIKTHAVQGAKFLTDSGLNLLAPVVRHHHERVDGSGYPDRLAGNEIELAARILAVADTFDALTSTRPYRTGKGLEDARNVLLEGQGCQHDKEVSEAFIQLLDHDLHLIYPHIAPVAVSNLAIKDPGVCPFCSQDHHS